MMLMTILFGAAVLAGELDKRKIFGQDKPPVDSDPTHGKLFLQVPVAVICNNVKIGDDVVIETLRSRKQYGVCEGPDHLGINACHVPFRGYIKDVPSDVYMRINYWDVRGNPNLIITVADVEYKIEKKENFDGWHVCEQVKLSSLLPGHLVRRYSIPPPRMIGRGKDDPAPSPPSAVERRTAGPGYYPTGVTCGTASWSREQVKSTLGNRHHSSVCPAHTESCFVFLPPPANHAEQAAGFSARVEFDMTPFKVIAAQSIHHGTHKWSQCGPLQF